MRAPYLIIDDEAAIRESLADFAGDGRLRGRVVPPMAQEGLTRIGERAFDLVLLDLALARPQRARLLRGLRDAGLRNSRSS